MRSLGWRQLDQRTIGGRNITRYVRKCDITGVEVHAWREIVQPMNDSGEVPRTGWSYGDSAAERFSGAMASVHTSLIAPADPEGDALAFELRRLRDQKFEHVARLLEQTVRPGKPVPPAGIFAAGDTHAAINGLRVLEISNTEVAGYVARHVAGDAGLHGGQWSEIKPSEDELYCPPLATMVTQNRIALSCTSGLITSRYGVFRKGIDDPKHEAACVLDRRRRDVNAWLECVTLLVPGRPNTTFTFTSADLVTL